VQSLTEDDSIIVRGTADDDDSGVTSVRVNGVNANSSDGFATWTAEVPLALGLNDIVVDSVNNRALVIDSAFDAIIAADLTGGARTVVSNDSTPDTRNLFTNSNGIAVNEAQQTAFVVDEDLGAVLMVDLTTGRRVILSR
jgi:hypothetical protein